MKTVREHLEDRGYRISDAKNFPYLYDYEGTMECEEVKIEETIIKDSSYYKLYGDELRVEATAIVPFSDGYMKPYPSGWGKSSMMASITLYFFQ